MSDSADEAVGARDQVGTMYYVLEPKNSMFLLPILCHMWHIVHLGPKLAQNALYILYHKQLKVHYVCMGTTGALNASCLYGS